MRSIRPPAARRLCAGLVHEPVTVPFRPTHLTAPCLLSTHQAPLAQSQRRFYSPSPSHKKDPKYGRETPFATPATTQPKTHYELFSNAIPDGAPPEGPFDIDLAALKREFLQLQARAHPDMHVQSDKKRAEALSSTINTAYKTLQSPLLRAQYLLSLHGVETAEDETAKVDDPELLMEVLEARELIEEAEREEDLEGPRRQNEARIRQSVERMESIFSHGDWELASEEVVRLRYWMNIRDSIEGWERGVPVVVQH